jgi:S1-C subfamily serine protease
MSQVLHDLSTALAGVVESAGTGVVRVDARRRLSASGIVWSADGIIVTAHHVARRDEDISVGLPDGQTVTASLVARDPTTDVAVLRADATDFTPVTRAEDDLQVGHLVLALGRPGRTVQATLGIVSALGERGWRTPAGGELDRYLQTDVVMYPGFSGGPLVDVSGRVLGLNTSALLRGVSLTVPTVSLGRVVGALLAHGRIRRGYLGIGAQRARLPSAVADELGRDVGLLVVSVEPNSAAANGGILVGDTIVTLDGVAVASIDDLMVLLGGERVGATIPVKVVRGGQLQELSVTIGERPSQRQ